MRGDDASPTGSGRPHLGPPPRARGRRSAFAGVVPHEGSTPACAGTTILKKPPRLSKEVHPRVRGDDVLETRIPSPRRGPPPRARGRRFERPRHRVRGGSTPACAGTTSHVNRSSPRRSVHPRVRGDDRISFRSFRYSRGPPPRARGRHLLTWCFGAHLGEIDSVVFTSRV